MIQIKITNKKAIGGVGVGIWVLAMVVLHYTPSDNATFMDAQFKFNVFCPISYDKENRLVDFLAKSGEEGEELQYNTEGKGWKSVGDLKKLHATNNPVLNTTYVVFIKVRYNSNDPRKIDPNYPFPYLAPKWQLSYCSLAAQNGQKCSDVDHTNYVCMSPGPAFFVKQGEATDVIWVNDITPQESNLMPHSIQDGYHQNLSDPYYQNEAKTPFQVQSSCTYQSNQEAMGPYAPKYQLDWNSVPTSTHVHGLEVRPSFDGHPLSWFTSDGAKGVGFLSLGLNDDYYNQDFFREDSKNIAKNTKVTFEKGVKNIKHNRYPNDQLPGNLWYHDHGMRATYFNVRNGLAGAYIIYNETVEAYLDSFTETNYLFVGDYYITPQPDTPVREQPHHANALGNPTYTFTQMYSKVFNRATPIRFKFLNGNFLAHEIFWFSYFTADKDGKQVETLLPVTIIGTDSTLSKNFLHNVTYFEVNAAERLELILDLSKIPAEATTFSLGVFASHVVFQDGTGLFGNFTSKFYLSECSADPCVTSSPAIPDGFPSLPEFVNLSSIKPDKMRFRVLDLYVGTGKVNSDDNFHYFINGHQDFMVGDTQNPQIGTTEDWFYSNFLTIQEHPLHIHLVQFQILEKFRLREFSYGCTFYAIEFYRRVNFTDISDAKRQLIMNDNAAMCDFLNNQVHALQHLESINAAPLNKERQETKIQLDPLDQAYTPNKLTRISGVYLFKPIPAQLASQYVPQAGFNQSGGCDSAYDKYAFICNSFAFPEYQRKWKEIAVIPKGCVTRFRIRFTSPDYPLNDHGDDSLEYYKLDEVSLTEYPGYVIHCHILFHEDSEMMRGFMMQFSERWKRKHPKYKNWKNWASVMNGNKKLSCANH